MPHYRISKAARLLGMSDDTLRRWIEAGKLEYSTDSAGRRVISGRALAAKAVEITRGPKVDTTKSSARNQLPGLVTKVQVDGVMAQVDMQCGPFRICSLMSREAAESLQLAPGVQATAIIKATNVIVETPYINEQYS